MSSLILLNWCDSIAPILTYAGVLKYDRKDDYSYTIWEECAAGIEIMLFVAFLIHFLTYVPSFGTFSLRFHLHFDEIDHEPAIRSVSTDPTIALLRGDDLHHHNSNGKKHSHKNDDRQRQSNGYNNHTNNHENGQSATGAVVVTVIPNASHSNRSSTSVSPNSGVGLGDDLDGQPLDGGDPFLSADLLDGAAELTGELPADAQQLAKHVRSLSGDRHYMPRASAHQPQSSSRASGGSSGSGNGNKKGNGAIVAAHPHYSQLSDVTTT
jgi:hypothetical protein